jgi:hypothetical protein
MHRSAGHCREIIKVNITIGYKKLNVKNRIGSFSVFGTEKFSDSLFCIDIRFFNDIIR